MDQIKITRKKYKPPIQCEVCARDYYSVGINIPYGIEHVFINKKLCKSCASTFRSQRNIFIDQDQSKRGRHIKNRVPHDQDIELQIKFSYLKVLLCYLKQEIRLSGEQIKIGG